MSDKFAGKRPKRSQTHLVVTPSALVISLSEDQQEAARRCLEKSGEVKFSLREVSVTELLETKASVDVIVD